MLVSLPELIIGSQLETLVNTKPGLQERQFVEDLQLRHSEGQSIEINITQQIILIEK